MIYNPSFFFEERDLLDLKYKNCFIFFVLYKQGIYCLLSLSEGTMSFLQMRFSRMQLSYQQLSKFIVTEKLKKGYCLT